MGADHGYNGSGASVAGSWPVAWVRLDNDHLGAVATNDWARLDDRARGKDCDVVGNAVRRVAAVARVAQPSASARWRIRGQYIGKPFETF